MDGMRLTYRACCFRLALLIPVACADAQSTTPSEAPKPTASLGLPTTSQVDGGCTSTTEAEFKWSDVPPIRPTQRSGQFLIPPTGPGYYSASDQKHGEFREKAPNLPYGIFGLNTTPGFDVDYRYLSKADNTQWDWLDPLKRIHPNGEWLLSFGGQAWARWMSETDSRLGTVDNDYLLLRNRTHLDLWYLDQFRFFAEYVYAESLYEELNPLAIDVNRSDLLNLFVEAKLYQCDDAKAYARVGRQEIILGSQRLVSSPDWANNRRTFQGVRGYYVSPKWDLDLFWVQPVIPNRNDFDSVDNNQNFWGTWFTRKVRPGTAWDLYYLGLDNTNATATGQGGVKGGQEIHTFGTRCSGNKDNWLWDVELMLQVGDFANQDKRAVSTATGVGYHWKDRCLSPQFWVYYDWASGDDHPGRGGENNTFNQLFPFGHYYYGFLDLVGRQNIHDLYGQFGIYPTHWCTLFAQWHSFRLDSSRDALYNFAGTVLRQDPTGQAGRDVGNELDLVLSMQLTTHANLLVGYSMLFSGSFIANTGPDVSPQLFYVQYSFRW